MAHLSYEEAFQKQEASRQADRERGIQSKRAYEVALAIAKAWCPTGEQDGRVSRYGWAELSYEVSLHLYIAKSEVPYDGLKAALRLIRLHTPRGVERRPGWHNDPATGSLTYYLEIDEVDINAQVHFVTDSCRIVEKEETVIKRYYDCKPVTPPAPEGK